MAKAEKPDVAMPNVEKRDVLKKFLRFIKKDYTEPYVLYNLLHGDCAELLACF